jgi:hypothetical protein
MPCILCKTSGANRISSVKNLLCKTIGSNAVFRSLNLAMLAKRILMWINESQFSFARVLRAKYLSHGDILIAGPNVGSCFVWQNILASLAEIQFGSWVRMLPISKTYISSCQKNLTKNSTCTYP